MSNSKLYPVVPMRGAVLFPGPTVPLLIGRAGSLKAIEEAVGKDGWVFVVAQRSPGGSEEDADPSNLYELGVLARIDKVQRGIAGMQVALTGKERAIALSYESEGGVLRARAQIVKTLGPVQPSDPSFVALQKELEQRAVELGTQRGLDPEVVVTMIDSLRDPGQLNDVTASYLELSVDEKQTLLETLDVEDRMRKVLVHLQRQIDLNRSRRQIQAQVSEELQGRQKEMYLREQLRAIQKELGEGEEDTGLADLKNTLAQLELPEEARREANRELSRLERAGPQSTESQVLRTYLEWFVKLPWNTRSKESLDLCQAEQVLREEHHGLQDVKDRILEYLSVRKLHIEGSTTAPTDQGQAGESPTPESAPLGKAPILLFVGPPGVGKTSIAQSVAKALGREYVRIALGGARDEADIRGHRKTYVGAMPGRLLQGLERAGTRNPVVLLDEVDKLGLSHQGDPSSALLEVLDPAQNQHFTDHYLNVPFDLSEVLFIATANLLHTIPEPLKDRMEIVEFSGYTEQEKLEIAKKYLVPRELRDSGLSKVAPEVHLTDQALAHLISSYTHESGVRKLRQQIAQVARKLARMSASGQAFEPKLDKSHLQALLGRPKVHPERVAATDQVGVATGMYYTPAGGDIMFVEASVRRLAAGESDGSSAGIPADNPGLGRVSLVLTGQLGDVMKESARAALSFAATHADQLRLPSTGAPLEAHIHVPAGAIPKDGPSAGITMATALVSALSGKRVRRDVAMTGEVTLTGRVLPIGGLKEKVLGAHRAGARHIVLPLRNAADMDDIPEQIRESLQFHLAETLSDVLEVALVDPDQSESWSPSPVGERHATGELDRASDTDGTA